MFKFYLRIVKGTAQ
ncbi:hypothetical protein LINGRAHAP2_LOCUS24366 [Linum grandiflorum]